MTITLTDIGKRFGKRWVFRNIDLKIQSNVPIAILGANGSGKSTLSRIIIGMQVPSFGTVSYLPEVTSSLHSLISYTAPGMELPEEMTLNEFLKFHFTLKKLLPFATIDRILSDSALGKFGQIHISEFSSGMKQRVKLAQAIFADTPILVLDEPCTNLDDIGVTLYEEWMRTVKERIVIVASNDQREYAFCRERLQL